MSYTCLLVYTSASIVWVYKKRSGFQYKFVLQVWDTSRQWVSSVFYREIAFFAHHVRFTILNSLRKLGHLRWCFCVLSSQLFQLLSEHSSIFIGNQRNDCRKHSIPKVHWLLFIFTAENATQVLVFICVRSGKCGGLVKETFLRHVSAWQQLVNVWVEPAWLYWGPAGDISCTEVVADDLSVLLYVFWGL